MSLYNFLMTFLILLLIRIYIILYLWIDYNFHYSSLISPHLELKYLITSVLLKQHVLCKPHFLVNTLKLVWKIQILILYNWYTN